MSIACLYELTNVPRGNRIEYYSPYPHGVRRVALIALQYSLY
nr:MAG TPA: hypothetical protein [Bacteriophage sp.]